MSDLSQNQFFLHGLSGAGKGELQKILIGQYEAQGYEIVAVATGDLFREAKNDPIMAAEMKAGRFPASLALVLPGVKAKYRQFIQAYQAKEGKAILILDGAIRQGAIPGPEGLIPSQIDQIAQAFYEVRQEEGFQAETPVAEIAAEIKASRHIIVDVMPEDAEAQMRRRVSKEIASLSGQIGGHEFPVALAPQIIQLLPELIESIIQVVDAEVTAETYEGLKLRFNQLRQQLFGLAELTLVPSLIELLQKMDFVAELRDDDILAETRLKRISNLLVKGEGGYTPGFAAKALEEVGIFYDVEQQKFVTGPENSNCRVIENGQHRQIDFETFKANCAQLCAELISGESIKQNHEGASAGPESDTPSLLEG